MIFLCVYGNGGFRTKFARDERFFRRSEGRAAALGVVAKLRQAEKSYSIPLPYAGLA